MWRGRRGGDVARVLYLRPLLSLVLQACPKYFRLGPITESFFAKILTFNKFFYSVMAISRLAFNLLMGFLFFFFLVWAGIPT